MKLMFIVFEMPKFNGSGAVLRNYALQTSLSRLGQLTTVTVQEYIKTGKAHPRRKPSFIEADLSEAIVANVVRRVTEADSDLVIVEGIYLADISRALRALNHRVVVDMHNVESALLKEIDIACKGWWAHVLYRARWAKAKAAEVRLMECISEAWVCSEQDATRLSRIASRALPIKVVQNPIPAWCNDAAPSRELSGIKLLFVGHLGYRPNIRAVERLIQHIHPAIRHVSPDASLDICGRSPGKKLMRLCQQSPNTRLIVNPEDLGPIYADATVAVIPLNIGGGTRLKILEALALGIPVVASAKAAEGLNLVPEETHLEAETNDEFAAMVHRIATDHSLRARLKKTGREFAQTHHGKTAIDRAIMVALQLQI